MVKFPKHRVDLNLINLQSKYAPQELVEKSENEFKKQIKEIVRDINSRPQVKVILVAGPSSAGKTTSSLLIKQHLIESGRGAEIISMDNFFINRDVTPILEDGTYDFDNVNTVDIPYFKQFVNEILEKGRAQMPIFNFYTGFREEEYIDLVVEENSLLIIEGIHALNPIVLDHKHEDEVYKVFVNPNTEYYVNDDVVIQVRELRRMRRIIRDYYTRGITPDQTFKNWKNVVASEKKFIFPFKENADYILDTTHYYEPLMYKKYLPSLLDDSQEAQEIASDLSYFEELDVSLVPTTSLLREFLQGVIEKQEKHQQ